MGASNTPGNRNRGEFVLGTLTDLDSDEDEEEGLEEVEQLQLMETGDKNYQELTLKRIASLENQVLEVQGEINQLKTLEQSAHSKYAEHILQTILKLDDVETRNDERIREARKAAIQTAQNCLQKLDSLRNTNNSTDETEQIL